MKDKDLNNEEGKNKEGMGLPGNYFDSFSSRLFSKIKANEELKDYPLLGALEKLNPFAVPQGYFETKEELLAFPILNELKQRNFRVPANYFETLPARVANKLVIAEEVKEFGALAAVSREPVFALPEAYFDNFYGSVKEIVGPAKVISLFGRVLKSYQFAAAAAVVFLLTLTVILVNQKTDVQATNECKTFACLSKSDILNSGVLRNISEESLIEMLDESSLSDSLTLGDEKISAEEIANEIDVNTLTEEL